MKTNDVIALGNTLMDFLIEVDDNKLLELNLKKSGMHLIEEEQAKQILQKIQEHKMTVETIPGGSAANTLRCLGLLGANVILCGKVGTDQHGEMYVEEMKNHHVQTRINNHHKVTGHAITFITPDAERTFSVHLGASVELCQEDILEEDIAKSKILLLEGYQLEGSTKETVLHAAELAKKHGTKIAFDLSDGGVIQRNRELVKNFVMNYVDILFANEVEAHDFTGKIPEEAVQELGKLVEISIVKIGKDGSLIYYKNQMHRISSPKAQAIDTTGAGDTYAAGFLYGYCYGWPLEESAKLGSLLAAKIVEQKGVKFDKQNIEAIKATFLNSQSPA